MILKKIISIIIITNIIVIGIFGWVIINQSISIEYMKINKYPDSLYIINGEMPFLYKTHNGTIILLYYKYHEMPGQEKKFPDIFMIQSKNGKNWGKEIQITNDSLQNMHPFLFQTTNDTFKIYYSLTISGSNINWLYIESHDFINWTEPNNSNISILNKLWLEISDPPYFENAKKKEFYYSLIKNSKNEFVFTGAHDISTTDYTNSKLFILFSKDGKKWNNPINIVKKTCYNPSMIEINNSTYMIAYQYIENFTEKIDIIILPDYDLNNLTGPYRVYDNIYISFFGGSIFCLIIIELIFLYSYHKRKRIIKRKY